MIVKGACAFVGKGAVCTLVNIYAEPSLVEGHTPDSIEVLVVQVTRGSWRHHHGQELLHHEGTGYGFQSEAIDFQPFVLHDLTEVDVALVVVALEVGAVYVLHLVELHGVHPAGALFMVALLAVSP